MEYTALANQIREEHTITTTRHHRLVAAANGKSKIKLHLERRYWLHERSVEHSILDAKVQTIQSKKWTIQDKQDILLETLTNI